MELRSEPRACGVRSQLFGRERSGRACGHRDILALCVCLFCQTVNATGTGFRGARIHIGLYSPACAVSQVGPVGVQCHPLRNCPPRRYLPAPRGRYPQVGTELAGLPAAARPFRDAPCHTRDRAIALSTIKPALRTIRAAGVPGRERRTLRRIRRVPQPSRTPEPGPSQRRSGSTHATNRTPDGVSEAEGSPRLSGGPRSRHSGRKPLGRFRATVSRRSGQACSGGRRGDRSDS
jgi:hypothetical protein